MNQAQLEAIDSAGPHQAMTATADASGLASITLYGGRKYALVANTPGVREPACGGPVTFVASDDLVLEPIKLDKSIQACRVEQRAAVNASLSAGAPPKCEAGAK